MSLPPLISSRLGVGQGFDRYSYVLRGVNLSDSHSFTSVTSGHQLQHSDRLQQSYKNVLDKLTKQPATHVHIIRLSFKLNYLFQTVRQYIS